MVTVTTYAELQAAVMRDEPVIRLEAHAKQYYERKSSDVLGGGVVGAVRSVQQSAQLSARRSEMP